MLYSVLKTFLHPLTTEKMAVCGKDYHGAFAKAGVTLFSGEVPRAPPSWARELVKLKAEHPAEVLSYGYLCPEDAEALSKLKGGRTKGASYSS